MVQEAFDRYMAMRTELGRENKPRCMMDLATIGAKELKKQGDVYKRQRPDSVIEGSSVHEARKQAGRFLAQEHPVEADVVIGVPDSCLLYTSRCV